MSKSIREVFNSKEAEEKIDFLKQVISRSIEARRVAFLHKFLTDFDFMIAKIETQDSDLGVQSLLSDFESAIQANLDTEDKILLALRNSIQLSLTAIREDSSQTYPQIYARLPIKDNPGLLDLLNSYSPNRSWLRLISDSFRSVPNSLIQILGEGHTGMIDGCAISDDATVALSASRDATVRVWDLATGSCNHVLRGHADQVNSCSISGDGLLALSASDDGTLRLWSIKTGNCLNILIQHTDAVTDCALSKNGKIAVSSSKDGTVKVWNLTTGECTFTYEEHTDYVTCCDLSSDGEKALSGSCDGTLRLWNTQSGECFSIFENESSAMIDCALSGDGRFAISVSDAVWIEDDSDSQDTIVIKILKNETIQSDIAINTGEFPSNVREDFLETVKHIIESAGISFDNLDENTLLKLWDSKTQECICSLKDPHGDTLTTCSLSENGEIAISGTYDGSLCVWDLNAKKCLSVLPSSSRLLSSCSVNRNGTFALSASQNLDLRLWDLTKIFQVDKSARLVETGQFIAACKYASNGKIAVSVSSADIIQFWDTKSGDCLGEIEMEGHYWIRRSSISTESKLLLVTAHKDLTGKIAVINLLTGQLVRYLVGHTSPVFHGEISQDGTIGISGSSDQTIRIWNIINGQCLHVIDVEEVSFGKTSSCSLSSDGEIAVVGFTTGILKLWNTKNGSCLQTLRQQQGAISCCSINENGNMLLSSSDDNSLLIWNLDDGECLFRLPLDRDIPHLATFSPNGELLLYALTRQKIQVAFIETAEIVAKFSFDSWISNLAFSPTNPEIMVSDYSGHIHFMKLEGLNIIH